MGFLEEEVSVTLSAEIREEVKKGRAPNGPRHQV